jgi:energy-coupling factor transporter ATP-binding protein EcfA2
VSSAAPAGQLRAEDVSFAYLGAVRAALRHIDLAVTPGEVVLVTGASGCGKSTLALALCGLIPSRVHGELRGRVMFGDMALSGMKPHEASQLVGMVFQNPNLQLINQTVQSEVAFGPENLALPQPEIAARVDWCLDVTGMAGMRKAAVITLSGGQKQRTAIAATLAMQPRILVLDEPLSDLDPVGAQEVLSTLQRLTRDRGTGVVIIEHRVDEVAPWADRVVLMDDGRVVLDKPPRAAWAERSPWLAAGVGIPDMIRLAHAVPEAFGSLLPLSVEEAAGALKDTWFEAALAAATAERHGGAAVPAPAPPPRPIPAGLPGSLNGAPAGPVAGTAPATDPAVLSWEGVSVEFDGKRAVDGVTLAVHEGEWVAVIGANGSGKSTLTGLPVGLGKPSAGVVRFRGQPVRPGKVFEHAAQVALLLQAADDMLFETTVLKELEFGFRFRARPKNPVLDVPEAIEFFGFGGREEDSPWELSQGGRQRLALAALLVGAPGVLVLDEPTTGQDADHMRAFLRLLDRVRARTGITIVTVTHDIRGLASRAARIVLLGEGRVRMDGPTSTVFARAGELARWGVLAPPLARLQVDLLGPATGDVLLDVDELAAAVLAHRPGAARAAPGGTGALRP